MSLRLPAVVAVLNCALVLVVANRLVAKKEDLLESGQRVFLELAPKDPRSLMQGDYMTLRYTLARDEAFRDAMENAATRGHIVLGLDGREVATFARPGTADEPLGDREVRLGYRKWRRGWRFGIESFFFQEGLAETYDAARFAEVRVSPDGTPVLVRLLDENLGELN